MGKHKKNLRKEKAKVKLRAKKTPLTKAKNITDTSFKVRKIVLPEQLKSSEDTWVVTRKKQNVKELLSRLNHYNVSMKKSSLEGLNELLTVFPEDVLELHLSRLIEGASRLILDEDTDVRRNAIKLLDKILSQVPHLKMLPFFNILLSYLGCGMTHIHITVQDDALMMLDTLLTYAPMLVAASSDKILTGFLNMISRQKTDSRSDRTLTVNLGSKFTTVNWRIRVLHRLHDLLSAVVEHKKQQSTKNVGFANSFSSNSGKVSHHWNSDVELNIPIYMAHYRQTCYLPGVLGGSYEEDINFSDGSQLKNYIKVVLPLLMETWIEVSPENTERNDRNGSILPKNASLLLLCILKIICLLFELLELWDAESEIPEVISAYKKGFMQHIFPGFPYECNEGSNQGSKDRKEGALNVDPNCQEHNLAICMLFFSFFDTRDTSVKVEDFNRVLKYLRDILRNWKKKNDTKQLTDVVRHMILKCSSQWIQRRVRMELMMNEVVGCYMETKDENLLQVLGEVAVVNDLKHLRSDTLQKWLEFLPTLLCAPSISASAVKILATLACQNNPLFYSSLCDKLPSILNNLHSITVTGKSKTEGRRSIVNILYWVNDWSQDALKTLAMHFQCEHWDRDLTSEFLNLLKLKNVADDSLIVLLTPPPAF